ncbi:MAG: hypothetical protein JOZ43_02105 [Acidobacteriales bacterium]|nr:hypothetical protein [Terriglobales bacterium]
MARISARISHAHLVEHAVAWLRRYRCGIVISEQSCANGEVPDAIGWKRQCHSVIVECKVSRADFLADASKPFRKRPEDGLGNERYYLAPSGLIQPNELPAGWGLLEYKDRQVARAVRARNTKMRTEAGLKLEMNLLLACLARVEVRIEPQRITDFLKWKNRLIEYNGGVLPREVRREDNPYIRVCERPTA